jgi:subtilisin family serine protease
MKLHHIRFVVRLRPAVAALLASGLLVAQSTTDVTSAAPPPRQIDVNVLLDAPPTDATVADLAQYGSVVDVIPEIGAVVLRTDTTQLGALQGRPHVVTATEDARAERIVSQARGVRPGGLAGGRNTWNMDAVNVTDLGMGRTIDYDGAGTYVAVLDTGLTPGWRSYFDHQSIAVGFARHFTDADRTGKGGPGGSHGWEQDPISHGTFVSAMILGYQVDNPRYLPAVQGPKEGVAPAAKLIPVRVVDDDGGVPSSILARALVYVASLKQYALANHPVVASMSICYPYQDPILRAAVDYAIASGVLLVAAVGNSGLSGPEGLGLRYPAGWPEVISVGATGFAGQYQPGSDGLDYNWWREDDVPDPLSGDDFYVVDFSTRAAPGEDMDVVAPGTWVFGPFQDVYSNFVPDHGFGHGTSVSTPHVAGILALMAQKNPLLTQSEAEAIIEQSAVSLPAGCRTVVEPAYGDPAFQYCWGEDASGAGLADARRAVELTPLP